MTQIRTLLRPLIPSRLLAWRQKLLHRRRWAVGRALDDSGLPVERVFATIYEKRLWGGQPGEFYSGDGSDPNLAEPYCEFVRSFIREREIRSIVDVGCGDFRAARGFVSTDVSYLGVDVVRSLAERNNDEFGGAGVRFQVLNAIEQPLPAADLCLIRQVFQHLSNQQILSVLNNCGSCRYLLVSDHVVVDSALPPNPDEPHGFHARASGIRLDEAPFHCRTETVLEVPLAPGRLIRTLLIDQESRERALDLNLTL